MFVRVLGIALLLSAYFGTASGQCRNEAFESGTQRIAVREVHLVDVHRPTVDEQQEIAKGLVGFCFPWNRSAEFGERIRDEFQRRGYFKATITDMQVQGIDRSTAPPTAAVTARVTEGDRYRLAAIHFTGNKALSDNDALRRMFPIKDGDWFNIEKLRQGIRALKQAYGDFGFINFTPIPDFTFDEDKKLITMKVDIDEGAQYRIASFQVKGADENRAAALKAAWAGIFPPNSVYSESGAETFFNLARNLLPPSATPDKNLVIGQNNEEHRVSITLVVKPE
jgi:hypothetical protein